LALMNMSYSCYDTFSYTDYVGRYVSDNTSYFDDTGRFVIDNELVTDIPGEYYRTYPYNVDQVWPTRKMTLIVKDGEARLMVLGPDKTSDAPINNMRQPSKYVSTWSYDLGTYTGGQLGLFVYAHQLTFYDLKITDLSDDNNLPTDYCGANSTCVDSGVCVAVPVPDVCEDPVGAEVIDVTTLDAFEFWQDNGVTTGQCDWQARDLGRGTFMYQSSNAHGSKEGIGCNAMYRGGPYTDFVMQFDADNYDNDGIGFVFGYKSELEHFKIHKRVDAWPAPYDSVGGPNLKVMKRIGQYDCSVSPMNASNACYQAVAFIDKGGAFHQAMPDGAIQPWQYASTFLDYEIGRGVLSASVRMVMMIRDNQLRTYFTPNLNPNLKVGTFAFDMSSWGYTGGRVGVYMYAHQAQFFDIRIAPLSGSNTATEFCANGGTCNTLTGLCE